MKRELVMKLELNGNELATPITEDLIIKSIESLGCDDDSFLILSQEGTGYIQTVKTSDGNYILEYREGESEDGHFECAETSLNFKKVSAAFISYLNKTDEWKTSVKWQPLGYSKESNSRSVGLMIFSVITLFVTFAVLIYLYK